jgi:glycosyltransferase involved in cell wall biosynthesis
VISLLAVHQGGGLGGAPVSLLKLLGALDRDHFRAVALFTETGSLQTYAASQGIEALIVPTGGAFFYSAHARLAPRSLARFVRTFPGAVQTARAVLRQRRPELVHLNTSVLLAWAAAARRERVPVVWVVREVLGPNPALRKWHAGFIQRHARTVVAISNAVRACFANSDSIRVVHNAVDLNEFRPDVALERDDDEPTLVMLGSVQRVKGHWLMLDVLERLPRAKLMLVAGGATSSYAATPRGRLKRLLRMPLDNLDAWQRDALARGLGERIQVTGSLEPHQVARVLAASDVLVFPSLEPEGFGRPIIEAMAMARPVVATDLGPSREILGPEAGRLVPPDATALARALQDLLESRAERARLGRNGRQRAEACFGLDRQVRQMAAIYADALRQR